MNFENDKTNNNYNMTINTLNEFIKINDTSLLIEYISEKMNIHKERLKIVLIDRFESKLLEIDKTKQFAIILNNSHDNIYINNNLLLKKEVLFINNTQFITINSNIDCNTINFIIIEDNCILSKYTQEKIDFIKKDSSNNIFIIDDPSIINSEQCDLYINIIDNIINNNQETNLNWEPGNNVNCLIFFLNNSSSSFKNNILIKELKTNIQIIIKKIIDYLSKNYEIKCSGDSGYQLRKIYGETRIHKDGTFDNNKNINNTRCISLIIALNDDYEGGEFYFPIQNIKVKLKKGQIIAFPPYWTHPHCTMELLNRTYRYTINTWLYEDINT